MEQVFKGQLPVLMVFQAVMGVKDHQWRRQVKERHSHIKYIGKQVQMQTNYHIF